MGVCKDPRLTYLNDLGYNVVRLPRQGIVPLGVIGRDRKSKLWLGRLDQIWTSEEAPPVAGGPMAVGGLSGQRTSDIKISFGLDILASVLGGMLGATPPSLNAAYKNAKSLQFKFGEVRSVGIDPFAIGNFLGKGDLKPNPVVSHYFTGGDDTSAMVVSEVLESKSISVVAKRDDATDVSVNVAEIKAVVGAKVGVNAANQASTEIVYDGSEFLAFGYKAFGIGMADGRWQVYGLDASQGLAFGLEEGPKPLVDQDRLVDLSFDKPRS